MDLAGKFIGLVLFVGLIAIGYLAVEGIKENIRWRHFAAEHHCVEVSRRDNGVHLQSTVEANGSIGVLILPNPDTVVYRCDGGLIHVREE